MQSRCLFLLALLVTTTTLAETVVAPAPNGLTLPPDYQDWRVITVLQRADNNTLRVVIGNDIAIHAVRQGHTNPWPNGTIIGKMVWRAMPRPGPVWGNSLVTDKFQEVEFIRKDTEKFATTGGWGFSKWLGKKMMPYGDDAHFVSECFGCHTAAKDHDYVFIEPAPMPSLP